MKRNIWLISAAIIIAAYIIFNLFLSGSSEFNVESARFEELTKEKNIVILDVRSKFEFGGEKISGAQNISYSAPDFKERLNTLDKGKTYLVYCATGSRSAGACSELKSLGFKNIFNLKGGIEHWKSEGKPVVR